ncbi:hypothetical protein AU194_06955 [Mycobacterium sp. GA-2829]|nr:hypothetical protein AU194_06955 [Mycobacterium sp. GA-2829]
MVIALDDSVTLTDTGLRAYAQALHPKRLVTYTGGHFDAYAAQFDVAITAAREWFQEHLGYAG